MGKRNIPNPSDTPLVTAEDIIGKDVSCVGSGIFKDDPKRYKSIVRDLGKDMHIETIAKKYKVARSSIYGIIRREAKTFENMQIYKYNRMSDVSMILLDEIEKALDEDRMPVSTMPIALGILEDKQANIRKDMKEPELATAKTDETIAAYLKKWHSKRESTDITDELITHTDVITNVTPVKDQKSA